MPKLRIPLVLRASLMRSLYLAFLRLFRSSLVCLAIITPKCTFLIVLSGQNQRPPSNSPGPDYISFF